MQDDIIQKTADFVKQRLEGERTGHDWWHVYRVWSIAKHIANNEHGADMLVVELGALLHDIADWKFEGKEAGPKAAREWLDGHHADKQLVNKVEDIVRGEVSLTGDRLNQAKKMVEFQIVHDADNLDAIGAIGIARAFATGAKFNELIHDPNIPAPKHQTVDSYISAKGQPGRTVINHFHEQLLTLKDSIQTETGKQMAKRRHEFMQKYLDEFYKEWEGEG